MRSTVITQQDRQEENIQKAPEVRLYTPELLLGLTNLSKAKEMGTYEVYDQTRGGMGFNNQCLLQRRFNSFPVCSWPALIQAKDRTRNERGYKRKHG